MEYKRNIFNKLSKILTMSPVLLIIGARQSGKSTLSIELGKLNPNTEFYTLDEPSVLAATTNSETFVRSLPEKVILDEIQRSPELFLSIKHSVDKDRRPGRFILTGSANVLTSSKLSNSLAGRMSVKVLWPLSQGEIEGQHEDFTSLVFSNKAITYNTKSSWTELVERICTGGFPEVTLLDDWELKEEWFSSYIKTMLDRDVREIANVDGLRLFPRLLSLLALRASTVVNYADIGRLTEIAKSSLMRYVSLLESIFLVHSVPAWYKNPEKRLVKSSKLLFSDTGLLCRIRNTGRQLLIEDRSVAGLILENFVGMELVKQLSWSKTSANLYHYRSRDGAEVDFVLEDDRNRVVGIEIKTSVSVNSQDLSGLNHLRKTVGKKFHRGLILYTGDKSITLGKDIMAVPISALWNSTV